MDGIKSFSRLRYRRKQQARVQVWRRANNCRRDVNKRTRRKLTSPILISSSTTCSATDLVSFIYFTFILYNLNSNTNPKLNFHKNYICKFYYTKLIIFFDYIIRSAASK